MRNARETATVWFNAAVGAFRQGSFEESADLYRLGLGHDPTCVAALLDLGKACEHLGDWCGSLAALDTALEQSPAHPVGVRRRARVREEQTVFGALAQRLSTASLEGTGPPDEVIADDDVPGTTIDLVAHAVAWARESVGRTLDATAPGRVAVRVLCRSGRRPSNVPLWASGAAHGDGSLTIVLPGPCPSPGLLAALVRHEVAHLTIHSETARTCPHWLDESIAAGCTKPFMTWEREAVAANGARLLSLDELDQPPGQIPSSAVSLAYRQYAAVGHWLWAACGPTVVGRLLPALRRCRSADVAIREGLGVGGEEIVAAAMGDTVSSATWDGDPGERRECR